MNITKCSRGHYFDLDKSKRCPFCGEEERPDTAVVQFQNKKTVAYSVKGLMDQRGILTEAYHQNVQADSKTISKDWIEQEVRPVAGWLVCTSGKERGRFFALYGGKNFIGTSRKMDVVLHDPEITEENHGCVIYDSKNILFYVVSMSGSVILNGSAVPENREIHDNDELRFGKTVLRFIQYCNTERNWNEKDC